MQPGFWHQRWHNDQIGFHRPDVHPALATFWPHVAGDARSPVLVPLCGKSLDLHWLDRRGHAITGVELSEKAVRDFFDEAGLDPERELSGSLSRWRSGPIEIYAGDFFAWQAEQPFDLFYDRAALIALPPEMRPQYLQHLRAQLADDAQGLLITLEYDQQQMEGPPFAVHEPELQRAAGFEFQRLAREDALPAHPRFAERGLTALYECAYRITARG